jgi:hypothetical protein
MAEVALDHKPVPLPRGLTFPINHLSLKEVRLRDILREDYIRGKLTEREKAQYLDLCRRSPPPICSLYTR